jgi:hypothetical protein
MGNFTRKGTTTSDARVYTSKTPKVILVRPPNIAFHSCLDSLGCGMLWRWLARFRGPASLSCRNPIFKNVEGRGKQTWRGQTGHLPLLHPATDNQPVLLLPGYFWWVGKYKVQPHEGCQSLWQLRPFPNRESLISCTTIPTPRITNTCY